MIYPEIFFVFRKNRGMSGKFFGLPNGIPTENFLATGGEVAKVEQRGAKSGRLTEGPQRLCYVTECIRTSEGGMGVKFQFPPWGNGCFLE